MREILVTRQFERDIKKIPPKIRAQADPVIALLSKNPMDRRLESYRLRKISHPAYRVRIGPYRLIYSFSATAVVLHRFSHRQDVYKGF